MGRQLHGDAAAPPESVHGEVHQTVAGIGLMPTGSDEMCGDATYKEIRRQKSSE